MHYVRPLRTAKISHAPHGGLSLSVLFTITTDLGDSFLYPENGPLELLVAALPAGVGLNTIDNTELSRSPVSRCMWEAGMRVLEAQIYLRPEWKKPSDVNCTVVIHPAQQLPLTAPKPEGLPLGSLHVHDVLPWGTRGNEKLETGIVMPVTLQIKKGVCAEISYRTFDLGKKSDDDGDEHLGLVVEEDIGESIARHIWDAGVLTSAYFADACSTPEEIQQLIPAKDGFINVLELGSGVGILGITVASILIKASSAQKQTFRKATVLLTDVEEAEECARRNISWAKTQLAQIYPGSALPNIQYENLDWDKGKGGRFGPIAATLLWDLVILSDCTYNVDSLPALVGTLNALHSSKGRLKSIRANREHVKSSVLLATKPRHSSEQALFGFLEKESWRYQMIKEISLPQISDEDEVVQIYLLEKGGLV
ncbi:putative methyltransferase-domain-containing protein [Xylariaceae sp. FL0255]|nr:putative methyltransferase-domain-containing protein [Xylariaceae sp. FL0255]